MSKSNQHNSLLALQKLQFSDIAAAELGLVTLISEALDFSIASVSLNVKPESLNSLNGFVVLESGERYFFKTHTEENEQLGEYYNAQILAEAGYPVLTPKSIVEKPGQQIALYEVINFPTFFDLIKEEEDKILLGRSSTLAANLVTAQRELDKKVFDVYLQTLESSASTPSQSPAIYQLFSERLKPEGRLGLFYLNKSVELNGSKFPFEDLANLKWVINGVTYKENLLTLIANAQRLIKPANESCAIVGHGDAHNGNVFWDNGKLLYFDPAFAGRHDPLLDLTKPLFHNIFARWMYFPEQVASEIELSFKLNADRIEVEHNFSLSALRLAFLESKIQNLLLPTIKQLLITQDWKEYLRAALFCCPFLTVNLFAASRQDGKLDERYPWQIKMLGLAMAVEAGACSESKGGLFDGIFKDI